MRVNERVLDLTHTLTPEFPLYPVYDPVTVRDKFSVADDGFHVRSWTFDEHSGTHVDAPAHFGGDATVDRIEVSDLVIEASSSTCATGWRRTTTRWSSRTTCSRSPHTVRCPSDARCSRSPAGAREPATRRRT